MRNYKLGIITAMALAAALPERKLTKEFLESEVKEKHFTRIGDRITHCRIVTHSGFEFTGESAVVDAKNFDEKLGEQYAYEQALDGMWMPYGFWLHKALADHDNRLQPPSDDNKIEALAEKSKSEDLLAVSAVNPTVDSQEQHQEPTMDFGYAVKMMKDGKRVSRIGWNGKGMWLTMVHPDDDAAVPPRPTYAVAGIVDDATNGCLPWIGMKTADNKFVPWLASQTDVLAEDWVL